MRPRYLPAFAFPALVLAFGLLTTAPSARAAQDVPSAVVGPAAPAPAPIAIGGPIRLEAKQLARAYELVGKPAPKEDLVIPESDVRLALVLAMGAQELDVRKLDVFIAREIERRVRAGADASEFEVGDAEIDAAVGRLVADIQRQYPTLDPDFVLRSNQIEPSTLHLATRRSQLFQRVFIPNDTSKWPEISIEAVREHLGEQFAERIPELFGAEVDPANPQAAQSRGMMQRLVQNAIVKNLDRMSEIREADAGLPEGVALMVDDTAIRTDDVLATILPRLQPDDVRRARLWAVKSRLAEDLLTAAGAWLDDEAFAAAYDEHEAPYRGTAFPLEFIARTFKRFPSMPHYRRHFRITASFERMIEPEITQEALRQHLVRAGRVLGLETVDAEIILLSAYDFSTGQWKPDGWKEAERRARAVVEQLVEGGGENWNEVLEANSDFWDPPVQAQPGQQVERNNKGRFGPKNRNTLAQVLGESEYRQFVEGGSVADEIFFDVPTGGVGGPWRGPYGYYIAHVKARRPAEQHIDLDGDRATLVRQDYVNHRLNVFLDDAVRRAGFSPEG